MKNPVFVDTVYVYGVPVEVEYTIPPTFKASEYDAMESGPEIEDWKVLDKDEESYLGFEISEQAVYDALVGSLN